MSKQNFKQPILNWCAKGNNSRRNEETVIDAARADIPELKHLSKERNQTILDYFRRYQAGMRAIEPKAEKEAPAKAKPVKKAKTKKEAPAKKLAGPRLFLQHRVEIPSLLN